MKSQWGVDEGCDWLSSTARDDHKEDELHTEKRDMTKRDKGWECEDETEKSSEQCKRSREPAILMAHTITDTARRAWQQQGPSKIHPSRNRSLSAAPSTRTHSS